MKIPLRGGKLKLVYKFDCFAEKLIGWGMDELQKEGKLLRGTASVGFLLIVINYLVTF